MELLNSYIEDKYSSFDVSVVKDKKDQYKSYIMLDGYVIGVRIDVGSDD